MDLKLSDEQSFLVEAARQALGGEDTLAAARSALDHGGVATQWPTAIAAGWTGLISAEAVDGAEQGALEAVLVAEECGARLAGTHLIGHLPAAALFEADGTESEIRTDLARGERRAALIDASLGEVELAGEGDQVQVSGRIADVVDVADADLILLCLGDGSGRVFWAEADTDGLAADPAPSYDSTRPLATVTLAGLRASRLAVIGDQESQALALQQALIGAEALGAAEACLQMAREYAQDRHAFGRAIGSYQAIKHTLVEMLRRTENARALAYYAGWAWSARPADFVETALALRVVAEESLHLGARENIFIHGGVGATWEHDASLYYRRAELSRQLLGGVHRAARQLADTLLDGDRETASGAR